MSTQSPACGHQRELLAPSGTPDNPHAHLDPAAAAGSRWAWGNEIAEDWRVTDPGYGCQGLTLARPFHVDALRERFPPSMGLRVIVSRQGGRQPSMSLGDRADLVGITTPLPGVRPHGEGETAL